MINYSTPIARQKLEEQRLLCRDNDYRHNLIFDLIMSTSFWKKDSLLHGLDFKCYDMSMNGALYRFHYWNRRVSFRMPSDKRKAQLILQRIGKKPIECRNSNGMRDVGSLSRADQENEMLWAQGWFDTTITHSVHVPQLDTVLEALTGIVDKLDVPTTIVDTLMRATVNLLLLCKIDLKDWIAVSAWALNALMSLGVGTGVVMKFLSGFKQNNEQELAAQGLTDFSWLEFLMSFFSLGVFNTDLPKGAMMALTKVGGAARGITNIWQLIEKVVKDGIPLIYKFVTGVPYEISQMEDYFSNIREWYQEVNDIVSVETIDALQVDQEKCAHIENLYRQGMTYISHAEEMRMDPKMIKAIEFHFNVLKVFYDKVQASGAFKCSPRVEPIVIAITGDPGVGKSGMMYPLAVEILRASGIHGEELKNWSRHIYTRNVNQDYWDGYRDQLICMYDDFGQKRDTVAAPNEEFFEVIKTANLSPYNLNMASLHEKARTYFRSKAIILSSNTSYFSPQSLTHPQAVRRRIDVMIEVAVKKQFRIPGTNRIDKTRVRQAYPNGFSTEIYEIYWVDPMDGHHKQRDPVSYDEFLGQILAKYTAKMYAAEAQLNFINNLAAQGQFGLDSDLEDWTLDAWTALFNLYQDGFPGFPQFREEFEDLDAFKVWLNANKTKVEWTRLYAMKSNPMYTAMEHPVTRLFEVERTISDDVKYYMEKSKEHITTFFSEAKSFLQRAIEMAKKYPLITALTLAVPLVGALWWTNRNEEEDSSVLRFHRYGEAEGYRRAYCDDFVNSDNCKHEHHQGNVLVTPKKLNKIAKSLDIPLETLATALDFEIEGSQSGDYKTARNKIKTEASQSGDYKTAKHRIKTELAQSGDYKTTRNKLQTQGQEFAKQVHAQLQEDQNAFNLSKRVYGNGYFIEVWAGESRLGKMRGIFLRGRIFLTARHLLPTLERGTHVRLFNSRKKEGFVIPIERLQVQVVTDATGEMKDQVLIDMSVLVHDHADILGSVSTPEEMCKFREIKAFAMVPDTETVRFHYGMVKSRDCLREYKSKDASYFIRKHYEYNLETTDGDCGSPIIAVSTLLRRKLIGIHVAGATGIGIASPLNKDDIDRAMEKMSDDAQVVLDANMWVPETAFPEDMHLPSGDFTAIGYGEYFEGGTPQTDIRPSLIHGYKEPVSKPCHLKPIMVNGEVVDPLMNGLKKCAKPSVALNQDYLKAAVQSVRGKFFDDPDRQRVLTDKEALAGIEGDPFAAPIKVSTSAGYPWKRKTKKPGKTAFCGKDGEYEMSKELEQALRDREEMARNNERFPTCWVDTLKDERRPIAKVDIGKTRVFSAGPVDYIVASRKYLLGFTAHVAENRNHNEISVGTNVYSTDWDVIAGLMSAKGKDVIAGDFSNFDGTLNVEILHEILNIINDWYDDGEENQRIRKIIWRETVNSVHICGRSVYMWTHSQPSGCALTAILNSMYNAIACRYVWMMVTRGRPEYHSMAAFAKHVNMVSYGDDNLLNVSEEAIEFFNQLTMAEAFSTFGMTYTDEAKSGEMVKARTLDQVSYLKRKFKFDKDLHSWLAPLDLETVLEVPNWIRKCPDEKEATISNIEDAVAELSLHGKEVFYEWSERLRKVSKENGLNPQILTYYEYINSERFAKGMLQAFV